MLRHRTTLRAAALALASSGLATAAAAEVGESAPQFTLPSATGGRYGLDALLEQGPVVIVFYRAFW